MKSTTVSMLALAATATAAKPDLVARQTATPDVSFSLPPQGSPTPGQMMPDFGNGDENMGECISNGIELIREMPQPPPKLMSWYISVAKENRDVPTTMTTTAEVSMGFSTTMAEVTTSTTAAAVAPRQVPGDGGRGGFMGLGDFPTDFCPSEIADMEPDVATTYSSYGEVLTSWMNEKSAEISSVLSECPTNIVSVITAASDCTITPTVLASSDGDDEGDNDDDDSSDSDEAENTEGGDGGGGAGGLNSVFAASLAGAAAFVAAVVLL